MFGKKKKKTLIERLTGAIHLDEEEDFDADEAPQSRGQIHHAGYQANTYPPQPAASPYGQQDARHMHFAHSTPSMYGTNDDDTVEEIGELSVDVINSSDTIIIKAMIAGVKPSDVDVDITRDSVTIKATRHDEHEIEDENFHQRELYWGTFSRTITLPEEVDVDLADAKEKHGLLVIHLPKLDKNRKTKLQIKSN
jgi:HSP20 family protein